MNSLLQSAKEIFSWAKSEAPSKSQIEIFLAQGRGRSIVWSERKCEQSSQAEGGGVGIRIILGGNGKGGSQGFAFTTDFSREATQRTVRRAMDSASMLPEDEFRRLPFPALSPKQRDERCNNLRDPDHFSQNMTHIMERLKEKENHLLNKYPVLRSALRAGFSESLSEVAIVNSNGIEESFAGTHSGLGVSCLGEKDGERQEGGFGLNKRFQKDLDWDLIFDKAAERTLALLGSKTIPSGAVPVIFDPTVACEFLSLVSGAVCADSIQKEKSFFKGKLGQMVASPIVSVVDDGTLMKGIATSPIDDEGVPTQKTSVITQGKFEHILYDTYTALKDHTASTGNAGRAGFKSSPSSGTSNFYLEAGRTSRQKLSEETQGLYLYEVMGMHMADPISGDFSVAAIGSWLEKGDFKYGVRGVTLAGNLIQMLKNIDVICEDLTFFGSVGSPTFRVSELTVSGQ